MRPAHLCSSLGGVDWDVRDVGRINAQDKGLDSFGPRETSSGNNPTCCLRLGLIMITGESPAPALGV